MRLVSGLVLMMFLANCLSALELRLKPEVKIQRDVVLLGDIVVSIIFTDTKYTGLEEIEIGRAPSPFRRRTISSFYIKSVLYSVVSPQENIEIIPEQVEIQRGGFKLLKDDLKQKVREYIESEYPSDLYRLERLGRFRDVILPDTNFTIEIERVNPKQKSPGLNLYMVKIYSHGSEYKKISVSARIGQIKKVYVVDRAIQKGETINPSDLIQKELTVFSNNEAYIEDIAQVEGKVVARYIPKGTPLTTEMLEDKPVIKKGDIVRLTVENEKIKLWTNARALQSGRIGQKIWVQNLKNKKRVRATIVSPEEVKIENFR